MPLILQNHPSNNKRTRIQKQNETRILAAALDAFSTKGYRGTTVDEIADKAGMSKANVLYYFKGKEDIYSSVLAQTLDIWLNPLLELDPNGDPVEEIWQYARKKLQLSRLKPRESRLFANEILQGAPVIQGFLQNELRIKLADTCQTIQGWIDREQLAPVHPMHLIFLVWSSTQHYADFETQIAALSDTDRDTLFADAESSLKRIIVHGLKP